MNTANGQFIPSHENQLKLLPKSETEFVTLEPISFEDNNGKLWTAPKGTITDGASIPKPLSGFFGGNTNKEHMHAAIIHDAYCAIANKEGSAYQIETWQATHLMFYYACLVNGKSPFQAKLMYAGVRLGGPRWSLRGEAFTDLSKVPDEKLQEQMYYCEKWIKESGDSLTIGEIDDWMEQKEASLLLSK
ncbi:MAG: DUF1353 domain-containing protein [Bacteroidota bacterium]